MIETRSDRQPDPLSRAAVTIAMVRALGLAGLDATEEQCETWRRIAAGADYAEHTDQERKEAAEKYNTQCRPAPAVTVPPLPQASDFIPAVIPAPQCSPFDAACIRCAGLIQQYNTQVIRNAQNAYQRALCEHNNARNIQAGHPELVRNCAALYPVTPVRKPDCGALTEKTVAAPIAGGAYLRPNASWGAILPAVTAPDTGVIAPPARSAEPAAPPAARPPSPTAEQPPEEGLPPGAAPPAESEPVAPESAATPAPPEETEPGGAGSTTAGGADRARTGRARTDGIPAEPKAPPWWQKYTKDRTAAIAAAAIGAGLLALLAGAGGKP